MNTAAIMTLTEQAQKESGTKLTAIVDNDTPAKSEIARARPSSDIPNGGLLAWLQCAGSFFLFFNCWGVVNAFGELPEAF